MADPDAVSMIQTASHLSPDAVRDIQTASPETGLESSSIFIPIAEPSLRLSEKKPNMELDISIDYPLDLQPWRMYPLFFVAYLSEPIMLLSLLCGIEGGLLEKKLKEKSGHVKWKEKSGRVKWKERDTNALPVCIWMQVGDKGLSLSSVLTLRRWLLISHCRLNSASHNFAVRLEETKKPTIYFFPFFDASWVEGYMVKKEVIGGGGDDREFVVIGDVGGVLFGGLEGGDLLEDDIETLRGSERCIREVVIEMKKNVERLAGPSGNMVNVADKEETGEYRGSSEGGPLY
ncbi:hypothetical protein Tco_0190986 [Tanacetum coccineum]